jgi:hypothetical protein
MSGPETDDDFAVAELEAAAGEWRDAEERHQQAKATRDKAIIVAYQTDGIPAQRIADAFGVTDRWVWLIAGKRTKP